MDQVMQKDDPWIGYLGVFLVLSTLLFFSGMVAGGLSRFYGGPSSFRGTHQILLIMGGLFFIVSFILALVKFGNNPTLLWLTGAGLVLIGGQSFLGQFLLRNVSGLWQVGLHFGLSVFVLALISAATGYYFEIKNHSLMYKKFPFKSKFSRQALMAVGLVLFVLISGVFVSVSGARDACTGWPLCEGFILPDTFLQWVGFGHRLMVIGGGIFLVLLNIRAWRTRRNNRLILTTTNMLVVLFFAQAFVGAVLTLNNYPLHLLILHEATAASLISVGAILLISLGFTDRGEVAISSEVQYVGSWRQRFKDFLVLNKPVVVLLLLSTTFAGMVIGGKGFPSLRIVIVTLVSGALAAGGSGAINQYIDRDLDSLMTRTSKRPIPAGRLTPAEGLAFGVTALLVSFYLLAGLVNIVAALLALAGMIYYVVIYSILLKKRTVQNIVIGGGAGAIPPLVGWAAATGGLDLTALFLFLIIFLWTPPHFWALALTRKNEYAAAGVPMMPVARGELATKKLIFQYSVVLVLVSILPGIMSLAGWVYLVGAIGLGIYLIFLSLQVVRHGRNRVYYRMYRHSNYYLFLLFFFWALDAVIV